MTKIIDGSHCELADLKQTYEKWLVLMNMDAPVTTWGPKDAPWWYNERASLSQFAGALWQAGGWCFEEYRVQKHAPSHSTDPGWGRCDLAVEIDGLRAIAEAKAIWPTSLAPSSLHAVIEASLKDAAKQARQYSAPQGYRRLAMCFVAPALATAPTDAEINDAIQSLPGSSAWCFPASTRNLQSELNERVYPGTILALREC